MARYSAEGETIRLLRHPAAWPGGAFVMPATLAAPLPELPDCRFPGLFCRDFSPVVDAGVDASVSITRQHGTLDARFAPGNQSRVLIVSEMYRPEWTARAGGTELPVAPAWGGMIAVTVPPGAGAVELRYRPRLVMALDGHVRALDRRCGPYACLAKIACVRPRLSGLANASLKPWLARRSVAHSRSRVEHRHKHRSKRAVRQRRGRPFDHGPHRSQVADPEMIGRRQLIALDRAIE